MSYEKHELRRVSMSLKIRHLIFVGFNLALLSLSASAIAADFAKSYVVKGKRYYPLAKVNPGFTEKGTASWYDVPTNFGTQTASGERLNDKAMTAASPILPMNTHVKVTNLRNDKSVVVRINDRGPYNSIYGRYPTKRVIDLTKGAARKLGYVDAGTTPVKLVVVK